jgi:hypothetical protein
MKRQRAFGDQFLLFGFEQRGIRTGDSGKSHIHLLACFVHVCGTGRVGFDQHGHSLMILFGLLQHRLSLVLIGFEAIQSRLRCSDSNFGHFNLLLEFRIIQLKQHVTSLNGIALVDANFLKPT